MEESQNFFAGILAASTVKLASSIDDVVWLAKFLAEPKTRAKNITIYTLVCMFQTLFALLIATGGEEMVTKIANRVDSNMSPDKILTLLAGTLLFLYSIKLGCDYYKEECSNSDDFQQSMSSMSYEGVEMAEKEINEDGNSGHIADEISGAQEDLNGSSSTVDEYGSVDFNASDLQGSQVAENYESNSPRVLAIVAFLGSLDDLTLFVPMLAGQAFGWFQLMLGAMLSVGVICTVCVCLTRCGPVAKCLQRIPLVAIVAVFSVVLLVKGAIME